MRPCRAKRRARVVLPDWRGPLIATTRVSRNAVRTWLSAYRGYTCFSGAGSRTGNESTVQLGMDQRPIGNLIASIWEWMAVQLGMRGDGPGILPAAKTLFTCLVTTERSLPNNLPASPSELPGGGRRQRGHRLVGNPAASIWESSSVPLGASKAAARFHAYAPSVAGRDSPWLTSTEAFD